MPCSACRPSRIPSWIAFVWRSVLPVQIDEVVGVAEHAAQVELDDLAGLLVRCVARGSPRASVLGARAARRSGLNVAHRHRCARALLAGRRARARRCTPRPPAHELLDRFAVARARAHHDEETSTRGISRKRSAPRRGSIRAHRADAHASALRIVRAGRRARPPRGARAPGSRAARATGSVRAMSAPRINVSSASGWLACMASRVSTV